MSQVAKSHWMELEWRLLRTPLVILFLCIALAAGALVSSLYYRQHQQTLHTELEEKFKEVDGNYQRSQQALEIVDKYYPEFQALQEHYFLQPDERFNQWLGRIQALRDWQDFLNDLDVSGGDSREHHVNGVTMEKDFKLQLWSTQLDMQLLHTGNLLALFDYLYNTYTDGLYAITECSLRLQHANVDYDWKNNAQQSPLGCSLQAAMVCG